MRIAIFGQTTYRLSQAYCKEDIAATAETGIMLIDVLTSSAAKKLLEELLERPVEPEEIEQIETKAQHILGWVGYHVHRQSRTMRRPCSKVKLQTTLPNRRRYTWLSRPR